MVLQNKKYEENFQSLEFVKYIFPIYFIFDDMINILMKIRFTWFLPKKRHLLGSNNSCNHDNLNVNYYGIIFEGNACIDMAKLI